MTSPPSSPQARGGGPFLSPAWLAVWLLAFGAGAAGMRIMAGSSPESPPVAKEDASKTTTPHLPTVPQRGHEDDPPGISAPRLTPAEIAELEQQVKESLTGPKQDPDTRTQAMRAAVRLLAADPAAINRIYALSGGDVPARLSPVMDQIYKDCPGLLWPVLQRADFPTEKINLSIHQVVECLYYDLPGALETIRQKPDCLGNRFEDTVMKYACGSISTAQGLVQEVTEGKSFTDEQRDSLAATLDDRGLPLPEWAAQTKTVKERQWYRQTMADCQAWAAAGFEGTPPGQADQWMGLGLERGVSLTPEQMEAAYAPGREKLRDAVFYFRAMSGQPEEAMAIARRAAQDGRPVADKQVMDMMNVLYAHSPADPAQSMALLDSLQDPALRSGTTEKYLTRWAKDDPRSVLAYLPTVADETLREKIRQTAEEALPADPP